MNKRAKITEGTSSIGTGPLSFDVNMARRHGWTDAHIERVYDRLAAIVGRAWGHAQGRHPELYGTYGKGKHKVIVYIGPDEDGHTLDASKYEPIRGRKPKKPDRRAGERRADKRRRDDKRRARLR